MKKIILLTSVLLIALVSGCAEQPSIQPTPTPQPTEFLNYSPVASGKQANLSLDLDLDIGRNSYARGDNIIASLKLENYGNKEISIEYFPNMPFNIFLYDTQGNLLETYRGERAASQVSSTVMTLKPGDAFSATLNFSVTRLPGVYQVAAGFIGKPTEMEVEPVEGHALIRTEKIALQIT